MINVFLFGRSGRMGSEIEKLLKDRKDMRVVGGYSKENPSLECSDKIDLVIDFSLPETQGTLIEFVKNHKCALVSGTTGLKKENFAKFRDLVQTNAVFWTANMSFGVHLMSKLVETLASFDDRYSYHIEETHHTKKIDTPSGTAIFLEDAAKTKTKNLNETISHREGDIFGIHNFIAKNDYEEIEIKHTAHNRILFAKSAIDVGAWLVTQNPGYYGMEDFFKNVISN